MSLLVIALTGGFFIPRKYERARRGRQQVTLSLLLRKASGIAAGYHLMSVLWIRRRPLPKQTVVRKSVERKHVLACCLLLGVLPVIKSLRPRETSAVQPRVARVQSISLSCDEKYRPLPDSPVEHRLYVAALIHNNAVIIDEWIESVVKLTEAFPETYVSVLESGSVDGSDLALDEMRTQLKAIGVRHRIVSGEEGNRRAGRVFKPGDPSSGNRISFLSRLRNVVLEPLIHMRNEGEHFDKVVFLNDVLFCVGDVRRLLAHSANIACGYDFNGASFWDNWVMDYGASPAALHKCTRDGTHFPGEACPNSDPLRVSCCWNGLAVFDAEIIYAGVQFRRGKPDLKECSNSECSIFCRDAHSRGFDRVIVDPAVQVAYNYEFPHFRRRLPRQLHSLDEVKMSLWKPENSSLCCELPNDGQQYVEWDKCFRTTQVS